MSGTELANAAFTSARTRVPTSVADEGLLLSVSSQRDSQREMWQCIIDNVLIEWGKDPDHLADDGLVPPSRQAVAIACTLAKSLRDLAAPPPLRTVPDGEGGIIFERRAGPLFETLTITTDGRIQFAAYENARLIRRKYR